MIYVHRLMQVVTGLFCAGILLLGWRTLQGPAAGLQLVSYTMVPNTLLHLSLRPTPLSGLFLLMLGIAGGLSALYGLGYGLEYRARGYGVWLDAGTLVFIAAMGAVLTAANVFTFLAGWEAMSITSYLLVVYDSPKPGVTQAGLLYIAMTQIGSAFLFVAFFLLYRGTGSDSFVSFTHLAHTLPPFVQNVVFFCALIGLLLKAGIMPLHIWLPRAHPAAPSPVSALMSGVMIKTALYGLILVSMTWLHAAEAGWGLVLALLGIGSAVPGARLSSQETGLKRILAYSSIDNMGLMVLCAGVSLIARAGGEAALSGLAMTAALLQAWNHCLFKSALFQGAGAVLYAAHTDNLNQLGGLLRRLPWTGLFFLCALLSLMALPPWGGFTSEWMMFMALAHAASAGAHSWMGLIAVTGILALVFTGAFTVLSSLRIFGIGFLAEPRSVQAAKALEVPLSMRVSLGVGALLTLLSGVFSGWVVLWVGQALRGSLPFSFAQSNLAVQAVPERSVLLLGTVSAGGVLVAWLLPRIIRGAPRIAMAPTWTCGGGRTPTMSYTASGLSQPVERVWRFLSQPLAITLLYRPVWGMVLRTATLFRRIQDGHVRSYLVYLFATVLTLLLIIR